MAQRKAHKRNLSKGILEMKFMKRSKEKFDKEKDDIEGADFFGRDDSKATNSDGDKFVSEHSMVPIERLLSGRLSFKGMNPEVERIMKQELLESSEYEKALARHQSNQPEISDEQMARRLGRTISEKFNTKNGNRESGSSEDDSDDSDQSPPKRGKFLKPTDD